MGERDVDEVAGRLEQAGAGRFAAQVAVGHHLHQLHAGKRYRDLGAASFSDAVSAFDLSWREAHRLRHLGRIQCLVPALFAGVEAGRIAAADLILAAPCIAEPEDARRWSPVLERFDRREVLRHVRMERAGGRRLDDGRTLLRSWASLSVEALAMSADLQASLSQRFDRIVPWHEVLAEAVEAALGRVDRVEPLGRRRYRRVDLPEEDGVAAPRVVETAGGRLLLDLVRPDWALRRTGLEAALERAPVAPSTSEDAPQPTSLGQQLAGVVAARLRSAIERFGRTSFQVARLLLDADRRRVGKALGFAGTGELAYRLAGVAPSTASELIGCARVCERFEPLRRRLEEGSLPWTRLRAVAGLIEDASLDAWLALLARCSVRELESVARELGGRGRRGSADRDGDTCLELDRHGWRAFARLRERLEQRLGRRLSDADVVEEALALALEVSGAPAPLWSGHRIVVYRSGELAWVMGPEGPVQLGGPALGRLATGDVVRVDLALELDWGERAEAARVAGLGGPGRCPSGRRPGGPEPPWMGRVFPALQLPESLRAPEAGPRLRRAVFLRDGGRCAVAGCSSRLFLHVHHLIPRASGGGNVPANLYLCCSACHGRIHSLDWRLEAVGDGDPGRVVGRAVCSIRTA